MQVIEEKKFCYVLMKDHTEYFLTFLSGGPAEIDFCVRLSDTEVNTIIKEKQSVRNIISNLQSNHEALLRRRIVPSIWSRSKSENNQG